MGWPFTLFGLLLEYFTVYISINIALDPGFETRPQLNLIFIKDFIIPNKLAAVCIQSISYPNRLMNPENERINGCPLFISHAIQYKKLENSEQNSGRWKYLLLGPLNLKKNIFKQFLNYFCLYVVSHWTYFGQIVK